MDNKDAVSYINDNLDFEKVLQYYNVIKYKAYGSTIRCRCPIHGGDNDLAFIFNKENNLWFCHTKCQDGGDIFKFIMEKELVCFKDAIKILANILNLSIDGLEIKKRIIHSNNDTLNWLIKMKKHLEKIKVKEYNIDELNTLYNINFYKHFDSDILNYFNVKYCTKTQVPAISNRIVIPIYQNSILVGSTNRATKGEMSKWIHRPEGLRTSELLFNFDNISKSPNQEVIITEGVWDVLNAVQYGFGNCVGCFGAHLTDKQEQMLLSVTYNLTLAYDTDSAGIICTKKVIDRLKYKVNLKIANIPKGKDLGDLNYEEMEYAINNRITYQEWERRNK